MPFDYYPSIVRIMHNFRDMDENRSKDQLKDENLTTIVQLVMTSLRSNVKQLIFKRLILLEAQEYHRR